MIFFEIYICDQLYAVGNCYEEGLAVLNIMFLDFCEGHMPMSASLTLKEL